MAFVVGKVLDDQRGWQWEARGIFFGEANAPSLASFVTDRSFGGTYTFFSVAIFLLYRSSVVICDHLSRLSRGGSVGIWMEVEVGTSFNVKRKKQAKGGLHVTLFSSSDLGKSVQENELRIDRWPSCYTSCPHPPP